MKLIIGGRGYGKTLEMIKMSAETGCHIVARSHGMALAVMDRAKSMGLVIPFPLTYDQLKNPARISGVDVRGLLVDDVDALVQGMARARVYAVTFTDEVEIEYLPKLGKGEFDKYYKGDWVGGWGDNWTLPEKE